MQILSLMLRNPCQKWVGEFFSIRNTTQLVLRGFQVLAKSVPEGAKFRIRRPACGADRNFEVFASLFLGDESECFAV